MRAIVGGLGVLLVAQGIGGLANQLTDGGWSWFVVDPLEGLQDGEALVSGVMTVLGMVLVNDARWRSARRG